MLRRILWWICLLLATGLTAAAQVPVTGSSRMSLELEDVPLLDVLHMIAQQNNLNLVISGEVTGTISVRLDDVEVGAALDAILTANGYNYQLRDNVILVKPEGQLLSGELESRVVTLRWTNPVTAKMALEPQLSDKGSIVVLDKPAEASGNADYRPNRILITDYPAIFPALMSLLEQVDTPEKVILIEAKIIETKRDDKSDLGFLWPSSVTTTLSDDGVSGTATTSTTTAADGSAAVWDPNNGDWTWGRLSVSQVRVVLHLLEQDDRSRLVSDPRISTLENHEAEIRIETVIPIQTINRFTEGAATSDIVTFQDEEVGIVLKVTPRINEPGTITLDVHPQVEEIIGFSGPPDNQKPITSERSVQTTITVKDGETAAIGGLLKEDELTTVNRVPVLGHIPLIGSLLFSNKSVEHTTTDLIILITPHILD
jgi:type IV pilus assembly protein PilQ